MHRESLPQGQLTVVGGTYREHCEFPPRRELYGSGLRAAASIAACGKAIQLHTCADARSSVALRSFAAALRFAVEIVPLARTLSFHYLHPLAEPTIGDYVEADPPVCLEVRADNILRYGMVEAEAVVHGGTVVYDPQSPYKPALFAENGSTAERLAIVANRQEVAQMAKTPDLNEGGALLRRQAAVVVIKDGPNGAVVFDETGIHQVPVFKTRHVFPIGSGDVFSAVFACEWMLNAVQASEAARLASLATAWYCQLPNIPLPYPITDNFHLGPYIHDPQRPKRKVYLAGPFFNLMQVWCVQEVRRCLQNLGLEVFSPYHDVGLAGGTDAGVIARADLQGLDHCDVVFAILDGHDPGTIFEIGYARARGKPVVILLGDQSSTHLTMFAGTECQVFTDLAPAIYTAAWTDI